MKAKKKILWITLSLFFLAVLYLILGALLPYRNGKSISLQFKENFSVDDFYNKSLSASPDRAAIIESSQEALDSRLHILNEAKKQIILSTFSMKTDQSSKELFSVIYAAAKRGVNVLLLGDALSCGLDMDDDPMYYALASLPNVEIRFYSPLNLMKPWTINARLHDKYIIVDDTYLILGGRNTSNYFLGEYNQKSLSYDRDIFVYNTGTNSDIASCIPSTLDYFYSIWDSDSVKPVFTTVKKKNEEAVLAAAKEFETIYQALQEARPALFSTVDYYQETVPTNKITLIHNPTNLNVKEPTLWYQISELMQNATKRIILQTPYAVLDDAMTAKLQKISSSVPDCTLFINSIAGGDNFVASSDYVHNQDKVLDTGFSLYEFQGDHSMHNKSLAIDDDLSIIGSYNLDLRSTYLSTECMLVVHGEAFNTLLRNNIDTMLATSLQVDETGEYLPNDTVSALPLSKKKARLFPISSIFFQLFRYLI